MYLSDTKADALQVFEDFVSLYGAKYPRAVECLVKDKEALFAFYDFPAEHWQHLRTTNPIESTFATVRHRTRQTRGCGSVETIISRVFKLAHIWIGESAGFDFRQLQPSQDPVEQFCDQVAAEFLVPEEAIDELWKEHTGFDQLARQFKVSQLVIARRALDLKKSPRRNFLTFMNNTNAS